MKRWSPIGLLLVLAGLWSCAKPSVVPVSQELAAIDTLMQSRPDSALMLLVDTTMDDPYYQLLLSEALYKNDNPQLNRFELMEAMAWYDSVVESHPYDQTTVFLDARCHYMNGVGYYEKDSVVMACAEYLKSLEIMEGRFEDKELTGYKARFMALTYTRLVDVFSNQYLHKQAIYFGKQAASFYRKIRQPSLHQAWLLNEIGTQFDMMDQWDSAALYYQKAITVLSDTNVLMFRDISSHLAYLSYRTGGDKNIVLEQLYQLVASSTSDYEKLVRFSLIGDVYYNETQFDSALKYLNEVYFGMTNIALKKQVAEWLIRISEEEKDDDAFHEYSVFLAQFADQSELQSGIKSQLSELFLLHEKQIQDHKHKKLILRFWKIFGWCLFLGIVVVSVLVIQKKKTIHSIKKQVADLTNKWEDTNKTLQMEREAAILTEKATKAKSFAEEPICVHILKLSREQNFKAKIDYRVYKDYSLDKNQLLELRNAANMHYGYFLRSLQQKHPRLTDDDLNYCCLYLLGLKDADVAALMQRSFSTVCYRNRKIRGYFQSEEKLPVSLHDMLNHT